MDQHRISALCQPIFNTSIRFFGTLGSLEALQLELVYHSIHTTI
jgi:hypothetical protein